MSAPRCSRFGDFNHIECCKSTSCWNYVAPIEPQRDRFGGLVRKSQTNRDPHLSRNMNGDYLLVVDGEVKQIVATSFSPLWYAITAWGASPTGGDEPNKSTADDRDDGIVRDSRPPKDPSLCVIEGCDRPTGSPIFAHCSLHRRPPTPHG